MAIDQEDINECIARGNAAMGRASNSEQSYNSKFERLETEQLAMAFGVTIGRAREAQARLGFMYRQLASQPQDGKYRRDQQPY